MDYNSKLVSGKRNLSNNNQIKHVESQILSSSILKTKMHRLVSSNDSGLKSGNVKTRIMNMPMLETSKVRNNFAEEGEMYIEYLRAKYIGEIESNMPHGIGKLLFDNGDYLEG